MPHPNSVDKNMDKNVPSAWAVAQI